MDEMYRKTGGATTAITTTSFRQSEVVSGTQTQRDDKTETNMFTRTEANTAMDLKSPIRDDQSLRPSLKSRLHDDPPGLKQQLQM